MMANMTSHTIREVQVDDLQEIVRIHQVAFPGFLMTLMGPRFLQEYYRAVLDYKNGILLGAVDSDKDIHGFIAGFIDPAEFYRHFNARKKKMTISGLLHVAVRPFLWRRVLENMRRVEQSSVAAQSDHHKTAELASIAVDPSMGRTGLGKKLVAGFMDQAGKKSVDLIELTTDALSNDRVNAFYQGLGFQVVETLERVDGRRMYKYEYKLGVY